MSTRGINLHTIALIVCLLLIGCEEFKEPQIHPTPLTTNLSIKELRTLCGERSLLIDKEYIIGGYVTSCDKAGNFYRTFCIEDFTGGVEIMAGLYDLHNNFPLGHYVTVKLNGCCVAPHRKVLQIGLPAKSYSPYPTDYFYSRVVLDKHLNCYDKTIDLTPSQLSINSLQEDMCGRIVEISGLKLCSANHPDIWQINQEGKWKGYNFFCDSEGREIAIYTSEYASYADNQIPTTMVSICGIVQYDEIQGKEYYIIKMRDENDCKSTL